MKKAKKAARAAAVAPPPPAPASGRGGGAEGSRARIKYQGLLQDYEELVKETEAKRQRLQQQKQKQHKLLAEVKFLRRKYKSLSQNPSQMAVYRLRQQPPVLQSHRQEPAAGHGAPSGHGRQDFASRTSAVIDLNEACVPSSEEMEEFHGVRYNARPDKVKKHQLEDDGAATGDVGANDVKMAVHWDVRSAAGRVGKRKISWQDQLALKV